MRKSLLKWLPALVILLLVGCWMLSTFVIHAPPKKTVVAEFETYSILKAKDQYYLRIHDMSAIEPKSLSAIPMTSVAGRPSSYRLTISRRSQMLMRKSRIALPTDQRKYVGRYEGATLCMIFNTNRLLDTTRRNFRAFGSFFFFLSFFSLIVFLLNRIASF